MKKTRMPARIIRGLLGTLLALLLAAVFYVAVILAQPQPDMQEAVDPHQPLLTASPALNASGNGGAEALIAAFPGPVLCAAPGSGWTILSGESHDVPFEGGCARVLTFTYQLPDSRQVQAISTYPARATALLPDDGYRLSSDKGLELAGLSWVCTGRGDVLRLYAQGPACLYTVSLTGAEEDSLNDLLRPLTLAGGT